MNASIEPPPTASVGGLGGRALLIAVIGLLMAVYLVYRPGLEGPYLLDDVTNLGVLERGDESASDRALRVAFGNRSGPAGRPVSMASFLLDARDWPVPAATFKHTNVLIHLLCGVLAGWLALLLLRLAGVAEQKSRPLALFISAVWMLHPLNVSTTLYVVQRMTQLMTLFSLAALICYLHAVLPAIQGGRVRNRYLYVALFPFGLLSVLSKENGVLLLVAILSLHFTVVPPLAAQRHYRYWFLAGILLPLVIVVSFIVFNFADLTAGYRFHEFNLLERLLTETRVLCQSFAAIFLPVISEFTLFHDDIVISSGLLSPLSTLFSALFVVSLVTLAFVVRRRQPVLSFGLFWFFGWHLLESTFLPLELYFEHRNYLAMLGPVVVAAYYGAAALERVWKPGTSRGGMALAVLIPLICLLLTLQLTLLWRDDLALKGYWAERHPASFRAQVEYSYALAQRGHAEAGAAPLTSLLENHGNEAVVLLQSWTYACRYGLSPPFPLRELAAREDLQYLRGDISIAVRNLLTNLLEQRCTYPPQDQVLAVMNRLDGLQMRPNESGAFHLLYADFYVYYRQLEPALIELRKSFDFRPDPGVLIRQANLAAIAGLYEQSLVFLQRAREADRERARMLPSREAEIADMEGDLRARLEEQGQDSRQ